MIEWDADYKTGMYIVNIYENCQVVKFSNNDITLQVPDQCKHIIHDLIDYKYHRVEHLFKEEIFKKFIVRMEGNQLTLSLLNNIHPIRNITPKITATCEIQGDNIHCKLWLI